MDKIIVAVIVAVLVGGGMYYQSTVQAKELTKQIEHWKEEWKIAKSSRPASYGQLSKVNRVELANTTVAQECTASKKNIWGDSEIDFKWEMEFAYGVNIPEMYNWDIQDLGNGKGKIILPELSQLRPIMVDFTRTREIKNTSGNRWEVFIREARETGHQWLKLAADNKLKNDPNVIEAARSSAEKFLLPLINEANPDKQYKEIEVYFEGEDKIQHEPAETFPTNCVSIPA